MELVHSKGIHKLVAFRHSMIVIQQVNKIKENVEKISALILHQIELLLDKFELIELFHVKINLNTMVESLENHRVLFKQAVLKINEVDLLEKSIP